MRRNGVDYIFGLAGNDALHSKLRTAADDLCVCRAEAGEEKRRTWTELHYAAKSWTKSRRVIARLEATTLGFDVRYVVTKLAGSAARGVQQALFGSGFLKAGYDAGEFADACRGYIDKFGAGVANYNHVGVLQHFVQRLTHQVGDMRYMVQDVIAVRPGKSGETNVLVVNRQIVTFTD